MMITATVLGLSIGWVLPAQQASGPNWKDRAEYDIGVTEYGQAKDAKGRLGVLDKWSKGYPDSELWEERENAYLAVYGEMKDCRHAFDRAKQIRMKKPEHYFSISIAMNCIYTIQPRTDADLNYAIEVADYVQQNEAKVFDAANKPSSYKPDQFANEKPLVLKLAQQTKAYSLHQLKKWPEAEVELTKFIQVEPAQPNFSLMLGQAEYSQAKQDQSKVPAAIFNFARAGNYTGPGALPAASAKQADQQAQTIYKNWHGSMTDYDKVVALVKSNVLPPAGFTIPNINQLNAADFAKKDAWDKAHPELTWWRDNIQIPLSAAGGAALFDMNYKDAGLPPGPPASPMAMFTAKIVSMTPESNPKEMIVEMSDPADPNDVKAALNAKLVLDPPPPGTMPVGSEIKFKGAAKAFQATPFLVTFDVDTEMKELEGWTGTGPANAKQGKAKTAPKGKAAPKGKGK